jgi:hypothetical protein
VSLLEVAIGAARVVHDGQGVGLRPQPGRAGVFAPARLADAGDARAGRPDRPAGLLRLVEAMAGGPPGRRRDGRALGTPLPRSPGRVLDRSAPAQVPHGHADRVCRGKLPRPGGIGRDHRLGACAASRGDIRCWAESGVPRSTTAAGGRAVVRAGSISGDLRSGFWAGSGDPRPTSSRLDPHELAGADLPAVVADPLAVGVIRLLAAGAADLRPAAVHGLRGPGVPGPGRPGTDPIAGRAPLSRGDRALDPCGIGTGAEGLRPGAQGRLARVRDHPGRSSGRLDPGDRGPVGRGTQRRGRDRPVLSARRLRGNRAGRRDPGPPGERPGWGGVPGRRLAEGGTRRPAARSAGAVYLPAGSELSGPKDSAGRAWIGGGQGRRPVPVPRRRAPAWSPRRHRRPGAPGRGASGPRGPG